MSITAFKGFDADMKCRGFQYKVGETYEHQGEVEACRSGFHACENPFDVWNHYGPVGSRFAEVELSGETDKGGDDSKIASSKITIGAEISPGDFTKMCVDWLIEKTKGKASSGYYAQIGSSGNYAKIASSGNSAKIASSGKHGVISCCGKGSTVEGAEGTWISIAEYIDGRCVGFATGCIGVDGLKPDTPYRAKNGRLVEVSA